MIGSWPHSRLSVQLSFTCVNFAHVCLRWWQKHWAPVIGQHWLFWLLKEQKQEILWLLKDKCSNYTTINTFSNLINVKSFCTIAKQVGRQGALVKQGKRRQRKWSVATRPWTNSICQFRWWWPLINSTSCLLPTPGLLICSLIPTQSSHLWHCLCATTPTWATPPHLTTTTGVPPWSQPSQHPSQPQSRETQRQINCPPK